MKTIDAPVEVVIVKNAGHKWRSVGGGSDLTRKKIIDGTVEFLVKDQR